MTFYWITLFITAFLAYTLGSMKTVVLASNFVFHKNLSRLGTGTAWFYNFRRIYGGRGLVLIALVELIRDMLPILIGGWLLGVKGHPEAGRAFAGFCLTLGTVFPLFYDFRGGHGIVCMVFAALSTSISLGIAVAAVAAAVAWYSRYVSLGAVAGALTLILVSVLVIDERIVMFLYMFTALAVLLRHIPAVLRVLRSREEKFSTQEDITYKFDQKF